MKRKKYYKFVSIIVLVCMMNCISVSNVEAKAYRKNVDVKKSYNFAVPEGGWSTITVRVNYTELYKKVDSNTNAYYHRMLYYSYKTSYATEKPYLIINSVKHLKKTNNGYKPFYTFQKWKDAPAMSDGTWEFFACIENRANKHYANTTSNKAKVYYAVYCDGAIIPMQVGKAVMLGLNTK